VNTFNPGHLGRGGELLFAMHRDRLCSECRKPFVSLAASQKTCDQLCSDIREKRIRAATRTRQRVNRKLSAILNNEPMPKRGRPRKDQSQNVERKPPTRSGAPDEAKTQCQ
jgi:hypothetical protein